MAIDIGSAVVHLSEINWSGHLEHRGARDSIEGDVTVHDEGWIEITTDGDEEVYHVPERGVELIVEA